MTRPRARKGFAVNGNGATPKQHAWNRRSKPQAAVPDGTGCAHHFTIPAPPAEPLGQCRKCGITRLHSNLGTGLDSTVSPWRMWKIGKDPMTEDLRVRLPAGYHLAGPVE